MYSMSDEEFTAFANEAAPCFQQYVADGTISEFELPYELSPPGLPGGQELVQRRPKRTTATRVFECATADARLAVRAAPSAASSETPRRRPTRLNDACRIDDRHRRLRGDVEAGEDLAGVVTDLREAQAVLVDETLERGIVAVQATPTNCTLSAHRCFAASTEGASWLHDAQVGAQNHSSTGLPA